MNENKEVNVAEENEGFITNDSNWTWIFLLFFIAGFGWDSPENPKISELEKKVARLEGQMSIIGGKNS